MFYLCGSSLNPRYFTCVFHYRSRTCFQFNKLSGSRRTKTLRNLKSAQESYR